MFQVFEMKFQCDKYPGQEGEGWGGGGRDGGGLLS